MSPYVQPFEPEEDDTASKPDEPLYECTECEFVGTITEFVSEDYR
jgi:hypothetical protein